MFHGKSKANEKKCHILDGNIYGSSFEIFHNPM